MKIRTSIYSSALLLCALGAVVLFAGCDGTPREREAAWRDLGLVAGAEDVTGVAVAGGDVVVGTGDGVWRRPLNGSGTWTRSGLDSLRVRVLRAAPDAPQKLFAGVDPMGAAGVRSFYRSQDGGKTWTPGGDGLYDDFLGGYVAVEDVTAKPGTNGAVLFANLMGASVVHSKDGGATWQLVKGSLDEFGYPCLVYLPPSAANTLYQGCEIPLDFAWIRSYDVSAQNVTELGEGTLHVDLEDIENRRINSLTSFAGDPGVVYAGIEGGVVALEDDAWRWVWKHEGSEDTTGTGYVYVKYFWMDPLDPDHLLIGGGDGPADEDTRAGLLESFDGGETATELTGPAGLRFDVGGVRAGTRIGDGRDVLLVALTPAGARVVVRENP